MSSTFWSNEIQQLTTALILHDAAGKSVICGPE